MLLLDSQHALCALLARLDGFLVLLLRGHRILSKKAPARAGAFESCEESNGTLYAVVTRVSDFGSADRPVRLAARHPAGRPGRGSAAAGRRLDAGRRLPAAGRLDRAVGSADRPAGRAGLDLDLPCEVLSLSCDTPLSVSIQGERVSSSSTRSIGFGAS